MNIVTNNIPRDFIEDYQLSEKEREEFDYEQLSQAGTLSGRLFETDGQIYFYIGE